MTYRVRTPVRWTIHSSLVSMIFSRSLLDRTLEGRHEPVPAMRTPRHGTGAAVVGGVLWVPGGADVQAFGATDVVEYLVWRP